MALDQSTPQALYDGLRAHLGHALQAVAYAGGENLAIECHTCSEVLLEAEQGDTGNAGCDRCGTYDRMPGSRLCVHCAADELPVTAQMLRADWPDRPGLSADDQAALAALPDADLVAALAEAFTGYDGMWLHVLDHTRGDATRALLDRLGRDSSRT
jgi:hypothetical protein